MHGSYDPVLIAVSIGISILASYAALDLARSLAVARGRGRWAWLAAGALALGAGIWAMHFVGMLALRLPDVAIAYAIDRLLISILIAFGSAALVLHAVGRREVSRGRLLLAAAALAVGIAGMHYAGMWSMQLPGRIEWNAALVAVSIAFALLASLLAVWLAVRAGRTGARRMWAVSAVAVGLAVAGMHYVAMTASTFVVRPGASAARWTDVVATSGLAALMAAATLLILGIALAGSVVERALARRSAAAEEQRRLYEEAQAANLAKSQFLANMSHEIRTPINAIMGYTDLLSAGIGGEPTAEQKLHLDRIRASTNHLIGLINDVLDLSKVEAGQMSIAHERALALNAIAEALELVRPQAARRALRIEEACGAGAEAAYVGDPERVRQVLVNLLSNAIKFTPPDGSVRVSCGTARDAPHGSVLKADVEWTWIAVEDTGVGIAPDKLETIFDPFVQAQGGLTREHGGTGLGLTISRRLARLMGGDLTVRSEVGVGSTFTLWLPAHGQASVRPDEALTLAGGTETVPVRGFAAAAAALRPELEHIRAAWLRRMRGSGGVSTARLVSISDAEDHTRTFLMDIAQTLESLEGSKERPINLLHDSTEIQRTISTQHGAQRARLGWSEQEVAREFELLGAELEQWVERTLAGETQLARVREVVQRLVEYAREISLASYRRAMLAKTGQA